MLLQGGNETDRQECRPIFCALAIAHMDCATAQIQVLNPKSHAFGHPKSGTVQQFRHQSWRAGQVRQDGANFINSKHNRQSMGSLDTSQPIQMADGFL
jgi:hypothetical protein